MLRPRYPCSAVAIACALRVPVTLLAAIQSLYTTADYAISVGGQRGACARYAISVGGRAGRLGLMLVKSGASGV